MNIAFVGAVEGSAVALRALIDSGLAPGLVISLPLEAAVRHSDFADLGPIAEEGSCRVLRARDINGDTVLDGLRAFEADLVLVIGWSQICREAFRAIPRIGTVGFHPAPLPRMRGRAVIPWTILLGERQTAATLFWIDGGVDSGPILMQVAIPVGKDETARSLYGKQNDVLARMLPVAVRSVIAGDAPRIEQDDSRATYCARRMPADGEIDWHEPADSILRLIRAVGDPYDGAFTALGGEKLIIDAASPFAESDRFIGLAGQVQSHTEAGFAVRCGDGNCIDVTTWRQDGRDGPPKLHARLGGGDHA